MKRIKDLFLVIAYLFIFHASCTKLGDDELSKLKSDNGFWYYANCKADFGLCIGAVLNSHKAIQCDKCLMWVHNECSCITETQYETVQNSNCTWICPKCYFFNFSDSFSDDQLNLKNQYRFDPLTKEKKTRSSSIVTNRNNVSGLKFVNINSIKGKKLNCGPFLIFTNLMLWLFKKQKMTALLQLQNCFRKLAHTAYTKKTGIFMAVV